MRAYIIRRVLLVIPTLFILSVLVFLSVRFLPGDAIDVMLDKAGWIGAANVDRAALEQMLGLDLPAYVQYGRWIGGIVLRGTLGESLWGGQAIESKIIERLPVTLELGVLAIVIGVLIAVPVGVYSAIRQDTAGDYAGRTIAVIGLATPNFWLGVMVMLYPVIWWGWSPPIELIRFSDDPLGNLGMFLVPSAILGTALAASTMRMTRTMMLEVLRQDYIRTAWAKGLSERAGRGQARREERVHSGGDPDRPAAPDSGERLGDHGEHLRLAGVGAGAADGTYGPGLPGRHGREPELRGGGVGGESADRPALSLSGPAGPLPLARSE